DLQVCIGSPRLRSALWRFFARRGSEDVYVTCPEMRSSYKVSIHEGGACHLAFASDEHAREAERGWQGEVATQGASSESGRCVEQWRLREDRAGVATPLHVFIPADYLSVMSDQGVRHGRIVWLPPSRAGTAVALTLAVTTHSLPPDDWPGRRE